MPGNPYLASQRSVVLYPLRRSHIVVGLGNNARDKCELSGDEADKKATAVADRMPATTATVTMPLLGLPSPQTADSFAVSPLLARCRLALPVFVVWKEDDDSYGWL